MTLKLPRLIVVADSEATGDRPLEEVIELAVGGGARCVWLREKRMAAPERRALVGRLAKRLHRGGGVLLSSPAPGSEMADGIHLGANDPWFESLPVGRSCHSREDLERAAAQGCEWATLSPIFESASKPGYAPIGPEALARSPLPVWALGGVDASNARACLDAGARGVAVMGAVMGAADPAHAVAHIQVSVA